MKIESIEHTKILLQEILPERNIFHLSPFYNFRSKARPFLYTPEIGQ